MVSGKCETVARDGETHRTDYGSRTMSDEEARKPGILAIGIGATKVQSKPRKLPRRQPKPPKAVTTTVDISRKHPAIASIKRKLQRLQPNQDNEAGSAPDLGLLDALVELQTKFRARFVLGLLASMVSCPDCNCCSAMSMLVEKTKASYRVVHKSFGNMAVTAPSTGIVANLTKPPWNQTVRNRLELSLLPRLSLPTCLCI